MTKNREERMMDGLTQLLPLVGQQMLTADRVLRACGHRCGCWEVPQGEEAVIALRCTQCSAEATVHLIDGAEDARYTVLLLPPGICGQPRYPSQPIGGYYAR